MSVPKLDSALERYATALAAIEDVAPHAEPQHVLDTLVARDAVWTALNDTTRDSTPSLLQVIELDGRLKKQADTIANKINLADWRNSLNPPKKAWWWSLDNLARPHRWDRFDWLWSALAVLFLVASLSLLVDISTRFLSGGPDTLGALAVITQSTLTLLAAGGALTVAGREGFERILASLRIPKSLWKEAKLGFAAFVLLGLLLFRLSLPQIAISYNNSGLNHYQAGHLSSAQFDYTRALKLNPDYAEAHYNLGLLYEDLQDFDAAKAEYQIAVQGGLDAAYNNLARLYILSENYSAAIPLLLNGIDLAQDDTVRYDMLKNLGWARLGQARYTEAETHLRDAIAIADDPAPAHCLLAQVLEAEGNRTGPLTEWENCLKYADGRNSDEDTWIGIARQRLEAEGDK